jgi:hypothetical protein
MTSWGNISHQHCHMAMIVMNKLIPNFKEQVKVAKNLNSFCTPVCDLSSFIYAGSDMKASFKQVPMMHAATIQAGSRLLSQIGSMTVGIQTRVYLQGLASLLARRRNMASPTML